MVQSRRPALGTLIYSLEKFSLSFSFRRKGESTQRLILKKKNRTISGVNYFSAFLEQCLEGFIQYFIPQYLCQKVTTDFNYSTNIWQKCIYESN